MSAPTSIAQPKRVLLRPCSLALTFCGKTAESTGYLRGERWLVFSGKVVQCSLDHDTGEQLVGYGGAVALLRYAM